MKKVFMITFSLVFAFSTIAFSSTTASRKHPWLGIHILMTSKSKTEQLTKVIGDLAEMGVNTIVAEINYGYEYTSHPELRASNPSGKKQIKMLVAECKKHKIRLIPQFQCLGHQSWSGSTFPLLTKYPQFDESPGRYPKNKGIYCRSWCPLHPEVNPIIFKLMDELITAFEADALHVGMDEVFLIADDACRRCKGKNKAKLFAKAVNDYHKHIVGKHKIEMLMWGDRLIDAAKLKYSKWEASADNTAPAVDLVPKDIIICDWHYGRRDAYKSIPMFMQKGFRVWPASWKNPEASKAFVDYSLTFNNPKMVGHMNTTWGAVPINKLTSFEPLKYSINKFSSKDDKTDP